MIIDKPVLVLVGPTAIGKTGLSLSIAKTFGCEVVSVDSMQVYRYMDIGTAKVAPEERREVPHHLIDIVDPDEPYHAARFAEDALASIRRIHARGAVPLLTGGTGLYLRALLEGLFAGGAGDSKIRQELREDADRFGVVYLHDVLAASDPLTARRLHPHDSSRIIRALEVYRVTGIPFSHHLEAQRDGDRPVFTNRLSLGLDCPREILYERINRRSAAMIERGLEQEVRDLCDRGYSPAIKAMQAIGYRHMVQYINGTWARDEMLALLARDTRRYAKRQLTWFRKDPAITWFSPDDGAAVFTCIDAWLRR